MPIPTRRRDAAATRDALLDAARHRFAKQGYGSTTVREIADDAGVNVALISRYFQSKDGLFEACLLAAATELSANHAAPPTDEPLADRIARRVAGGSRSAAESDTLVLLIRSSGDPRAEGLRLGVLSRFAEDLATRIGWEPGDPSTEPLLVRAQLVLCMGIGLSITRASTGLEPLHSAPEDDVTAALRDAIGALLGPASEH